MESFKHQKYIELTEEMKSQKDTQMLFLLRAKLRALSYDPETRVGVEEIREQRKTIESRARSLLMLFEEKERLVVEDLEASLLCEVSRLNLLNFLKVFGVDLKLGGDVSSEERDQLISGLRGEVQMLSDQVVVLRSKIIVQVLVSLFLLLLFPLPVGD